MIDYPSAHVTNHIYNSDDLKSPLDREQAMLKGDHIKRQFRKS